MADNTTINTGTGGDTIATDDITTLNGGAVSGVKAQRVKVGFGSDASFRDVDASNGLPVSLINGQATMASSTPVTIASDQTTRNLTVSGTGAALNDTPIASTDVLQYKWVSIQVTGTFVSTYLLEWSNDNTTFYAGLFHVIGSSTASVTNLSAPNLFYSPVYGKYCRLRLFSYTSGTVSATAIFNVLPPSAPQGVWVANVSALNVALAAGSNTVGTVNIAAGTNIVGKVGLDQTSDGTTNAVRLLAETTKVIGTVNVAPSQTIAVTNAGTFAVQSAATLAAETTKVIGTVNIAASQSVAATLAAETTKVIGTVNVAGSQTIATTNAGTFAVQATLAAETTKVIGTVNMATSQTIAVTNAGTFTTQDSEKLADNAPFTDGTTKVVPVGYTYDDVSGTALTENDIAAARIDSKRSLMVTVEDATTRGQKMAVSASGAALVAQERKASYRASTNAVFVPAVTVTIPFFTIYGSATKTVRIQSIIISGITLTAVAYVNIGLRKYSTAASGGTTTGSPVPIPMDSNSAAATATVLAYTVGPTAGTTVGDLSSRRILGQSTTAAAAGIPQIVDFDFSPTGDSTSIVLRGVAQGVGLYFITAPATTISCLIRVEFTEE